MDSIRGKGKKAGLIIKTWERCKSFGGDHKNSSGLGLTLTKKTKSWPRINVTRTDPEEDKRGRKPRVVAPEGCFSVYVGPQKQRFVIKTEYVNHPLFKVLLEEAEFEYGYSSEGPIELPCKVDHFLKVLAEMDHHRYENNTTQGCAFTRKHSSYHLRSPSRIGAI